MAATLLEGRMQGASSVIVNVSGSKKLRLREIDDVAQTVVAAAGRGANIVFGMSIDRRLRDEVQVTLIATGFDPARSPERQTAPASAAYVDGGAATPADATPADATPAAATPAEWRPVWLRRTVAANAEPTHTARSPRRKRRPAPDRQVADGAPDPTLASEG